MLGVSQREENLMKICNFQCNLRSIKHGVLLDFTEMSPRISANQSLTVQLLMLHCLLMKIQRTKSKLL